MPYEKGNDTETFGAQTFTIEVRELWHYISRPGDVVFNTDIVDSQVWLVSKSGPKHRVRLPVPPLYKGNPFSFDLFVVSPDERVIFAKRKIASDTNQVFVFQQVGSHTPLHYRLTDRVSLNDHIGRTYGRPREEKDEYTPYKTVEFIDFETWEPNGRDALLSCSYGGRGSKISYLVALDTHTGRLHDYHRTDEIYLLFWPQKDERFPQTRLRLMSHAEVAAMSPSNVHYAINEMYFRRGYRFPRGSKEAAQFKPREFDEPETGLTQAKIKTRMFPTERANLALLTQAQAAAKGHKP